MSDSCAPRANVAVAKPGSVAPRIELTAVRAGRRGHGARDAEVAEGGAAQRGLEQQAHHAHHAVKGAERPEERGSRREARRGQALEQEVHERLDDGAEEDHEGDVAHVGVAQEEGKGERRGGRGAAGGLRGLLPPCGVEHHRRGRRHRQQEQDGGRGGQDARHGPDHEPADDPPRGGPGGDPPDHLPRGVGVEPLVDHRPEAGDERSAEGGDVQVEKDGGGPGPGEADRPPEGEQKRRQPGHRRDEARGRLAGEADREQLGPGEGGDRRGPHDQRKGLHLEGGEEQRVPHGARRDLLRDEKTCGERRGGDGPAIGGGEAREAHGAGARH